MDELKIFFKNITNYFSTDIFNTDQADAEAKQYNHVLAITHAYSKIKEGQTAMQRDLKVLALTTSLNLYIAASAYLADPEEDVENASYYAVSFTVSAFITFFIANCFNVHAEEQINNFKVMKSAVAWHLEKDGE